jgi:hypothetical protein
MASTAVEKSTDFPARSGISYGSCEMGLSQPYRAKKDNVGMILVELNE